MTNAGTLGSYVATCLRSTDTQDVFTRETARAPKPAADTGALELF